MQAFWKCVIIAALLVCGTMAQSFRRPTKVITSCCESVSKARITFKVTGYKWQNALDPCVEAVIFYTEKGQVCSDPTARWVDKKMEEVPEM
ncbi:C-C motif chemokine 8-like [Megalops cyprinoides]|uniref:C-C motif chemokine 8-like n=1 Tax=Megalops cyprinoides TaxID=118141 RepID=UPI001863A2A0|nr:C-C motif chemokine 8-like [Megalops cyprinoides]